jgi:NADP-dependent 3-hydroxy acid dehydrogenase YdfG
LHFLGDIAERRTAECSIAEGVARFGRIDTLINSAGVFIAKSFTLDSEADYAAILGVDLAGFFHMTQLVITEMEKRGSGHIVSVPSHATSTVATELRKASRRRLHPSTRLKVKGYDLRIADLAVTHSEGG